VEGEARRTSGRCRWRWEEAAKKGIRVDAERQVSVEMTEHEAFVGRQTWSFGVCDELYENTRH